jgi:predicted DNA-binding transcriptional regulator YafY
MRRADRLFRIIQILRRGNVTTAMQLASELEVSVRTVYRDMQDLMASNVPIEGEAGTGYVLADEYDLPPLMFSRDEVEALTLGARMVTCWGDKHLAQAARDILSKVDAVLPEAQKNTLKTTSLFSMSFQNTE